MYADDDMSLYAGDADYDVAAYFAQCATRLTPLDPEFHHLIGDPRLSAELAELQQPRAEPTTALLDGSARKRRDRRIADRLEQHSVNAATAPGPAEYPHVNETTEAA